MKELINILVVVTLVILSNTSFAQGNTCTAPLVIPSLPYSQSNFSVCGTGNDYTNTSTPCNGHSMNGEEKVFAYTPTVTEDVLITYESDSWDGGFYMFDACPFNSGSCLHQDNDIDTFDPTSLCQVTLTAGQTYYFVFSYWPDGGWNDCTDFTFDFSIESLSSTPTTQDCLGAIPLCQSTYSETNAYSGVGNIKCEVDPSNSCLGDGEKNSVWYTFTTNTAGDINFSITPNNGSDDYDWAVYDLTTATCNDIYSDASLEVRCNWSGNLGCGGVTGPNGNTSGTCGGQNTSPISGVAAGNTYAILVSQYSSSTNGYTIDFSASTASLYDNVPPTFDSILSPIPCGATEITFFLSENVLCNTADASDFVLTGPGGPYTLSNISSTVCDIGGSYDDEFTLDVSPPLITSGNFTFSVNTSASGSFTDICNNAAVPTSFNFIIDNISTSLNITDNTSCGTCNGNASVTATGGTTPYTYLWSNGETSSTTSSTLCAGTYAIIVTDNVGCLAVDSATVLDNVVCGPTAVLSANDTTICQGQSIVLSATASGTTGYTFDWLGGGINGNTAVNTSSNSQTETPASTTTYYVIVTDDNGDKDTANLLIIVNPNVVNNLSLSTCQGDSAFLGGSYQTTAGTYIDVYASSLNCDSTVNTTLSITPLGNPSYTYSASAYCLSDPDPSATITGSTGGTFTINNGGTINASTGAINITASGAGTFNITYATGGICSDTLITTITLNSAFDATITAVGPFCENASSVNLSGVSSGGVWSGTGITDAALGTFDPATAGVGTHTITYTISGSCGDTDTESIIVNATDDAGFSYPLTSYCVSDPNPIATITGLSGGNFTINNGASINTSTGEINLIASGAGNFDVTYTTNGSCPSTQTVSITIAGSDATITNPGNFCINNSPATFTAASPGGLWSGTGITDINAGTFNPATATPGTWRIKYTISGSCSDIDSVDITVFDLPTVVAGNDTTVCDGNSITLSGTGTASNYTWNNGITDNVSFVVSGTSKYIVTGVDGNTCFKSDSLIVTALALPNLNPVIANETCLENEDGTITLNVNNGTPSYVYQWGTGDSESFIEGLSEGSYSVTVTDSNNCVTSESYLMINDNSDCDFDVFVPNVFSPNGDNNNDILFVRGKGIATISFTIFNRWGNKVFESNNIKDGWDGTYNGSYLNNSVFVYYLTVLYIDGSGKTLKGNVSIIK